MGMGVGKFPHPGRAGRGSASRMTVRRALPVCGRPPGFREGKKNVGLPARGIPSAGSRGGQRIPAFRLQGLLTQICKLFQLNRILL